MSIIIRLQGLPLSAKASDIREFFRDMKIPKGAVNIVGGVNGEAFIGFATDEDARLAMALNGGILHDSKISLYLSSKREMDNVIANAHSQVSKSSLPPGLAYQMPAAVNQAMNMGSTAPKMENKQPQKSPASDVKSAENNWEQHADYKAVIKDPWSSGSPVGGLVHPAPHDVWKDSSSVPHQQQQFGGGPPGGGQPFQPPHQPPNFLPPGQQQFFGAAPVLPKPPHQSSYPPPVQQQQQPFGGGHFAAPQQQQQQIGNGGNQGGGGRYNHHGGGGGGGYEQSGRYRGGSQRGGGEDNRKYDGGSHRYGGGRDGGKFEQSERKDHRDSEAQDSDSRDNKRKRSRSPFDRRSSFEDSSKKYREERNSQPTVVSPPIAPAVASHVAPGGGGNRFCILLCNLPFKATFADVKNYILTAKSDCSSLSRITRVYPGPDKNNSDKWIAEFSDEKDANIVARFQGEIRDRKIWTNFVEPQKADELISSVDEPEVKKDGVPPQPPQPIIPPTFQQPPVVFPPQPPVATFVPPPQQQPGMALKPQIPLSEHPPVLPVRDAQGKPGGKELPKMVLQASTEEELITRGELPPQSFGAFSTPSFHTQGYIKKPKPPAVVGDMATQIALQSFAPYQNKPYQQQQQMQHQQPNGGFGQQQQQFKPRGGGYFQQDTTGGFQQRRGPPRQQQQQQMGGNGNRGNNGQGGQQGGGFNKGNGGNFQPSYMGGGGQQTNTNGPRNNYSNDQQNTSWKKRDDKHGGDGDNKSFKDRKHSYDRSERQFERRRSHEHDTDKR